MTLYRNSDVESASPAESTAKNLYLTIRPFSVPGNVPPYISPPTLSSGMTPSETRFPARSVTLYRTYADATPARTGFSSSQSSASSKTIRELVESVDARTVTSRMLGGTLSVGVMLYQTSKLSAEGGLPARLFPRAHQPL